MNIYASQLEIVAEVVDRHRAEPVVETGENGSAATRYRCACGTSGMYSQTGESVADEHAVHVAQIAVSMSLLSLRAGTRRHLFRQRSAATPRAAAGFDLAMSETLARLKDATAAFS